MIIKYTKVISLLAIAIVCFFIYLQLSNNKEDNQNIDSKKSDEINRRSTSTVSSNSVSSFSHSESQDKKENAQKNLNDRKIDRGTNDNLSEGMNFISGEWQSKNTSFSNIVIFKKNGNLESYSENVGESLYGQFKVIEYKSNLIVIEKNYSGANPLREEYKIIEDDVIYREVDGIAEVYERKN
ncbi:MAG: hypothetical protein RR691_08180 [Eubacterium sp.]|uniref:hypothetical protein n=1 Tax=Enterococcus sp. TaxID=35783 RepID=UPI002FCA7894